MKYPEEAPIVRLLFGGAVYVAAPCPCNTPCGVIELSDDVDGTTYARAEYCRPLTRSARRLVRWAKGGAR
jgi:hypothetical protein